MTTLLKIINDASSNGDIDIRIKTGGPLGHVMATTLTPGQKQQAWVSTGHDISISETWPTKTPASEQAKAGQSADDFIAAEVAIQDKMWGDANDRADSTKNQLIAAGAAQLNALFFNLVTEAPRENAFASAKQGWYPEDWNGFRDYGSNVANLVVAAAFIRSEIKRRILLGEDTTRAKRGETYKGPDFPNMTSEEAAKL